MRAEPIAFDYRCEYADAGAILDAGYRKAVLAWRGAEAKTRHVADELKTAGASVGYNFEPFVRVGTNYEADRVLFALADYHGALLRNPDGNLATVGAEWGWSAYAFDYSVPNFVDAWVRWANRLDRDSDLHYQDYGYFWGGIGWMAGLERIPAEKWSAWSDGYRAAISMIYTRRAIGTSKKWDERANTIGHAFIVEGIEIDNRPSRPLFTYAQAFAVSRRAAEIGRRALLFCLHSYPRHRRIIAAIAVATGALMSYRWRDKGEVWINRRIPELMDMTIGKTYGGAVQVEPGYWLAQGTSGAAVVNLTTAAKVRVLGGKRYEIPPMDALVVQYADEAGRSIPHRVSTEMP